MNDIEEKRAMPQIQSKTARKAWDVLVDVYLVSDSPTEFHVESYLQDAEDQPLNFHNNGHPGFNVTFELHDETGKNYSFARGPNKEDAIWSQLGSACPLAGIWDVFDKNSIQVTNNGSRLSVFNGNPHPAQGQFQYTLNVSTTGNPPYLNLDPGGNNQNGNQ
jgi:hypothetical protein